MREVAARKACPALWDCAGMSKGQQHRQAKKARKDALAAHDPLIVELVKLLARAAAERDYIRLCRSNTEGKAQRNIVQRQGE